MTSFFKQVYRYRVLYISVINLVKIPSIFVDESKMYEITAIA